jgi:hypothetical protein
VKQSKQGNHDWGKSNHSGCNNFKKEEKEHTNRKRTEKPGEVRRGQCPYVSSKA